MASIHLLHNSATRCGYNPPGTITSSYISAVTCLDCLNAQFSEFDFQDRSEISSLDKRIHFTAFSARKVVASLSYICSGGFMPVIMDLWVDPLYRGHGLGTMLMKTAMKKVGPPIQLKSEPYSTRKDEPLGLSEEDLKSFYAKLGFVGLTTEKVMLWYPVVKKDALVEIEVKSEGNYYTASVVKCPEIKGMGTSYNLALGNLIFDHQAFFGISFKESDAVKLVKEQ